MKCPNDTHHYYFVLHDPLTREVLAQRVLEDSIYILPHLTPHPHDIPTWTTHVHQLTTRLATIFKVSGVLLGPLSLTTTSAMTEAIFFHFEVHARLPSTTRSTSTSSSLCTWVDISLLLDRSLWIDSPDIPTPVNLFAKLYLPSPQQPWLQLAFHRRLLDWLNPALALLAHDRLSLGVYSQSHTAVVYFARHWTTRATSSTNIPRTHVVKVCWTESNEALLTDHLSIFAPSLLPQVIAVCPQWNVFVHRTTGTPVQNVNILSLARSLFFFQRQSLSQIDTLLQLGAMPLGPKWLRGALDYVLDNDPFRICADDNVITSLIASREWILECIDELLRLRMPDVVVHGDIQPRNIVHVSDEERKDGKDDYLLLDWGNMYMGHPLEDLAMLLDDEEMSEENRIQALIAFKKEWRLKTKLPDLWRLLCIAHIVHWLGRLYRAERRLTVCPEVMVTEVMHDIEVAACKTDGLIDEMLEHGRLQKQIHPTTTTQR